MSQLFYSEGGFCRQSWRCAFPVFSMFTSRKLWAGRSRLTHFLKGTWLWRSILWLHPWLLVNTHCILSMIRSSCHLSWTATHCRSECSWWKNFYIFQRRGDFFSSFSKTTVVGDLTLQVLLIWTVSSLGGFPSSPQPLALPLISPPDPHQQILTETIPPESFVYIIGKPQAWERSGWEAMALCLSLLEF